MKRLLCALALAACSHPVAPRPQTTVLIADSCESLFDRVKSDDGGKVITRRSAQFVGAVYAAALELHGFNPSRAHPQALTRAELVGATLDVATCFSR